jgi:Spy/CpxP family protein refolding chaperone
MRNFNKIFFGLVASGSLSMIPSTWAAEISTVAPDSDRTSESILISQVPKASPQFACPGHEDWSQKLGLTEDQMTKLVDLKSDYNINTAKQKAEVEADKKKLILLMTEAKIDKQAVTALNDKIVSLKANISDARLNKMLSVMNILTPEQREKVRHHMLVRSLGHHHRQMASKFQKGGPRSKTV